VPDHLYVDPTLCPATTASTAAAPTQPGATTLAQSGTLPSPTLTTATTADPCVTNSVVCQNGGVCKSGVCNCAFTGYMGPTCSDAAPVCVHVVQWGGV
jgi:hypothetical protein